jgi:hypothetical protein
VPGVYVQLQNPDSKKVSEVAKAAGDKWRSMSEAEKGYYEKLSTEAKDNYKAEMVEYDKDHPKPLRRAKKERDPAELKRPQSAYFFFLADFREEYKVRTVFILCLLFKRGVVCISRVIF